MTPDERDTALDALAGQIAAMDVALGAARTTLRLLMGTTAAPTRETAPEAPRLYNGMPG